MFDSLVDLVTASAISYLVIVGFVWLDAWFPVVPGESLIIAGAVLAAGGELSIWLVLLRPGGRDRRRQLHLPARPRAWHSCRRPAVPQREEQEALAWVQEQLERRPWVILVSRYVPGGRTAVMFASGTFAMEWRTRFLPFELGAATLWTGTTAALGYFFGSTFQGSFWLPLLVSFAVAGAITVISELVFRRIGGDGADEESTAR